MPKNDCNLTGNSGVGKSCRAWILEGSGCMPLTVKTVIWGCLIQHLELLKTLPCWGCCLHKLQQLLVMFLRGVAVDTYVIMYGDNAGEMVCYLDHAHLKDILGHLQTKRHAQELVPATMSVKCGQVGKFFV